MAKVTCNISVSVDGYVAGPRQSLDNPIGEGGTRLHEWHFNPQGDDQAVIDEWQHTPGAYVMGRKPPTAITQGDAPRSRSRRRGQVMPPRARRR